MIMNSVADIKHILLELEELLRELESKPKNRNHPDFERKLEEALNAVRQAIFEMRKIVTSS